MKGFRARLVPARVAAAWDVPELPEREGRVVLCSRNVLDRARRKLGADEDVYVRMELVKEKSHGPEREKSGEAETKPDGSDEVVKDEGIEGWLVEWNELPVGCVVLLGKNQADWQGWGTVR